MVEDPDQLSGKPPIISVQDIAGNQEKVKVAGNGVDLSNRTHPQMGRFNVLYDDYLRDAGSSDENDSEVYEINKFNVWRCLKVNMMNWFKDKWNEQIQYMKVSDVNMMVVWGK